MKIKRAVAVVGTLALSSGVVLALGPTQARAGVPLVGFSVGNAPPVLEGDVGTVNMTFPITRNGATGACELIVQTVNGTATGGADYVAFSQTISVPAGSGPVNVIVTITADTLFEPDSPPGLPDFESLQLIALPGTATDPAPCLILDGSGTGLIQDDDQPGDLNLAMEPDFRVCESALPDGTVTAFLKLNRPLADDETLSFNLVTQNGTAQDVPDIDYVAQSVPYSINGLTDTNQTFIGLVIPIIDDFWPELDESFQVELKNVVYTGPEAHFLVDTSQIILIRNDDVVGQHLYVNDTSVVEGDAGDTTMTFTISSEFPAICDGLKVHYYSTDGTATDGGVPDDYDGVEGYALILPGQTSVEVDVTVHGDTVIEADETINLHIDEPIGVTDDEGSDPHGVGTIIDDDFPFILSFEKVAEFEGSGGGTKNMTFTITLSDIPKKTGSVFFSASNVTALAPGDYTASSGTVTFVPGDSVETFSVPNVKDNTPENDENFDVNLSQLTNIDPLGSDTSAQGIILNDDVWVADAFDATPILEGHDGDNPTVPVTIQLNAPAPPEGICVDWALVDGTAVAGEDFIYDSQVCLLFSAGQQTKIINVTIISDTIYEVDEATPPYGQFTVDILDAYLAGAHTCVYGVTHCGIFDAAPGTSGTVSIINDDEELPETGANTNLMLLFGLAFMGAGLVLVGGTRRRQRLTVR